MILKRSVLKANATSTFLQKCRGTLRVMERQQRREHNNRSRMAHLGEYEGKVERDCNSGCYWQRDRPTSSILMLLFLSSLFGFSQLFSLFTFTTIKNSVWIKVEESKLWKTKFMFVVQRKCQKCNGILQDSIFLNIFYYHINVFCKSQISIIKTKFWYTEF